MPIYRENRGVFAKNKTENKKKRKKNNSFRPHGMDEIEDSEDAEENRDSTGDKGFCFVDCAVYHYNHTPFSVYSLAGRTAQMFFAIGSWCCFLIFFENAYIIPRGTKPTFNTDIIDCLVRAL